MATHDALDGTLVPIVIPPSLLAWRPSRPVLAVAGELHLTPDVDRRLQPTGDDRDILRAAAMAAFDQFVELGPFSYRQFHDSWGRLGVAQLKVLAPDPGSRLIGAFIKPSTFIGLRLYWRDELDFKRTAQIGLIDYKTLGEQVAAEWEALMPGIRRIPMKEFLNV